MITLPAVKVLLVDDLDENLLALEAALRRDGLEFHRAKTGPDALELLLVHDFALALLDVQMPGMDGFELAELMRGTERTREVPIIFLTAGTHDAKRVFRGYEVGAVDFLFKPVEPVLLRHKVSTFTELYRQRLELREALRLNEMFMAAVSHDLRQPLMAVLMGTALLERDPGCVDARRTLARMRSSAQRMTGMLEQLYDLARARLGGGIALDRAEVDVGAQVTRLVDELRLAHPGRSLAVEFDGGPTVGHWDEHRLGQLLANLLGNALRHGGADEEVRVKVSGSAAPCLVIEVHNGGEIPDAVRRNLFDPFRGGSPISRDGLGLGLYIVHQIVIAHGGTIDVSSSRADGVTFRVTLPTSGSVETADHDALVYDMRHS